MNSRMRIALLYAAILILSSVFMRDVFNFLVLAIGRTSLTSLVWCGFLVGSLVVLAAFRRLSSRQVGYLLVLLMLGCLYAYSFEIFEERIHLLKYGLLSWLIASAISKQRTAASILSYSVIGAALTGCCDEVVQSFSPGRVGDPRDVIFDTIGGVWGGLVFLAARDTDSAR